MVGGENLPLSNSLNEVKSTTGVIVYIQAYFITIATILGTGILGLPVTLAESGFYPFLALFIINYFFQALVIIFFTDVLQRVVAAQKAQIGKKCTVVAGDKISVEMIDPSGNSNKDDLKLKKYSSIEESSSIGTNAPNLHLVAELFLPTFASHIFDLIIILLFMAILISYSLAGSGAYAQVIKTKNIYVLPVFVGVLTLVIIFAQRIIQPVVSFLTFFKGTLLLATISVTMYVGSQIHQPLIEDYAYIGGPFLMGTVALGGIVNVLPLLYTIENKKPQVERYRYAILAALTTCLLFNIMWCWAVLAVVPQMCDLTINNTKYCNPNITLHHAKMDGSISTVPLTMVILDKYKTFQWIAILIQVFIIISITVSYLTLGAAFNHTLEGWLDSKWKDDCNSIPHIRWLWKKRYWKVFLSLFIFCIIFIISMLNPSGFVDVLDKGVSFFLNLEVSIFIFWMCRRSREGNFKSLAIPCPLPKFFYHLIYLLPIYFGICVTYDIAQTILEAVKGKDATFLRW